MPENQAILEQRLRNIEMLENQGKIEPETAKSLKDDILTALASAGKAAASVLTASPGEMASGFWKAAPMVAEKARDSIGSSVLQGVYGNILPVKDMAGSMAVPQQEKGGYNPVEIKPDAESPESLLVGGKSQSAMPSSAYDRFDRLLAGNTGALRRQTKETQEAIGAATERRSEAVQLEAEAGKAQAQAEAAYREESAKEQAAAEAKFQAEQAEIRSQQESLQRDIGAEINELGSMKITDRRSVVQKIGSAIAIGLGAYASATSGGPNHALAIINKQIDDDIAAQRSEFESKKAKITGQQNAYQRLRSKLGDNNATYQAMRVGYLDQVKNQLSMIALKHKGTVIEARAQDMAAKIEQESAAIKQDVAVKIADQVRSDIALRMQAQQQQDAESLAYAKSLGNGGGKQLPAARAEAIGKIAGTVNDLDRLLGSFKEMTGPESIVSQFVPGSKTKHIQNQLDIFTVMLVNSLSGAQVSDKEIERYVKMVPKATTFDSTALNQLQALKNAIVSKYQSIKNSYSQTNWDVSNLPDYGTQSKQLGRAYEG
jgi:hypothetical protein